MSEWTTPDSERGQQDVLEEKEWIESLDWVIKHGGPDRVRDLLRALQRRAAEFGISLPYSANTPYVNTIPSRDQPRFPGQRAIERRIKSITRWNAMAMVVRANRMQSGIGGVPQDRHRFPGFFGIAASQGAQRIAEANRRRW